MRKLKVFISMGFTGKDYDVLVEERKSLHKLVDSYNFELLEQFLGYQFREDFNSKSQDPSFIVGKDKNWIMESDVVLVDLTSHSIGAYQEIVLAKELFNKKVYGVVPKKLRNHYWIRFYVDYFFDSIEEALDSIAQDFTNISFDKNFEKHQYNYISSEYRLIENTPVQKVIYDASLTRFVKKNAVGKKVLVLHAASGHRARIVKNSGAGAVVGVDLSYKQIYIAKEIEMKYELGIEYYTLDVHSSDFLLQFPEKYLGSFDYVIGYFLLDHSSNKGELEIVVRNIKTLLKKGGSFYGLIDSPESFMVSSKKKYGVIVNSGSKKRSREGDKRRISVYKNGNEIIHFFNFLWEKKTIENVFKDNEFKEVKFDVPQILKSDLKKYEEGFWDDYIKNPDQISVLAKK